MALMAVVVSLRLPGVSKQQWDQLRDVTGWLEQVPEGGFGHFVWWEGDDCHAVGGFESEAAFNAFGADRLMAGMASIGLQVQPEIRFHEAHEVFTPRELRLT